MTLRQTLDALNIELKKSLGQNFMVNPGALDSMLRAADLSPDDVVLEVGAGLGALTDRLAETGRRVVAVEIDRRFIDHLNTLYTDKPHVEVVKADILQSNIGELLGEDAGNYKAVANLPYYITTAIIRYLLESDHPPQQLVITVQREVGERMAAKPNKMSLLAVSVQLYGAVRVAGILKPGNFYPPPKVESAIMQIIPHTESLIAPTDRKPFFRIVKAGFSQKRKQIKNCLKAGFPDQPVLDWLESAGLDPRRRAETFTVDEWLMLYRASLGDR